MKKYTIRVNGIPYEVEVELIEDDEEELPSGVPSISSDTKKLSELPSIAPAPVKLHTKPSVEPTKPVYQNKTADSSQVTSPLTGVVSKVLVKEGQQVKWHEVLMEIEAMKMITKLFAQEDGVIQKIHVKEGDTIQVGQLLISVSED